MLYKKASEMKPTPIPHCMGGEGTVMMERLLDAPAEMLGKGRAYVRHTLAPGVTIAGVLCILSAVLNLIVELTAKPEGGKSK